MQMPYWLISPKTSAMSKADGGNMALALGQLAASTHELSDQSQIV